MKKLSDNISGRDLLLSIEERTKRLGIKLNSATKATRKSVFFLDSNFRLFPGPNLIVAGTGRSKTSCAANQVYHTLRSKKDGLIVCVLNEETEADFYTRIACIELQIPFNEAKFKNLGEQQQRALNDVIRELLKRVLVVDQDEWNTNKLEDILEIINNTYRQDDVAMILIDYLQNINETQQSSLQNEPQYAVSKVLGSSLKDFGKNATCPIVIFAQVHHGDTEVIGRVQHDRTFGNHCKTVLELLPDFENQVTDVSIAKDRFNAMTGKTLVFKFKVGALNYLNQKVQEYGDEK